MVHFKRSVSVVVPAVLASELVTLVDGHPSIGGIVHDVPKIRALLMPVFAAIHLAILDDAFAAESAGAPRAVPASGLGWNAV
jgi:hypothetical protein